MDYNKIYQNLIKFRKKNRPKGYVERHHILPTSLGGSNNKDNIVILTGREHWVAHLLLHKIHRKPQTNYACHIMAMGCEKRGISYIKNSRMYEAVRKEHSKHVSDRSKQRLGNKNGSYETMWICNPKLKENRKIQKNNLIPEGWTKGRNKWKTKRNKRQKRSKPLRITNGIENCVLHFEDQLIPNDWYHGSAPIPKEVKQKISSTLKGKPRPYRVGLKYKRRIDL